MRVKGVNKCKLSEKTCDRGVPHIRESTTRNPIAEHMAIKYSCNNSLGRGDWNFSSDILCDIP